MITRLLRLDKVEASFKATQKTREKSQFVADILALGLKAGQFAYVSHKEWLSGAGQQTEASQKNGPRYTLKRYGFTCQRGNMSGKVLAQLAEAENRELVDTDIIYSITPSPKIE